MFFVSLELLLSAGNFIACGVHRFPLVIQALCFCPQSLCLQGHQASKPQGDSRMCTDSSLACRELWDLVSLTGSSSVYILSPGIHIPMTRKKLWKSCNSERLDSGHSVLPGSKYILGCSSRM
jgi:hypothetical protein